MPGEAPNILKAKFLIPSNLGGGPFFGFGLLFQHSSKHFWDVHLFCVFLIWGDFCKGFWKKGPGVLEKRWQNIGCKAAHRAQVKKQIVVFPFECSPSGPGTSGTVRRSTRATIWICQILFSLSKIFDIESHSQSSLFKTDESCTFTRHEQTLRTFLWWRFWKYKWICMVLQYL